MAKSLSQLMVQIEKLQKEAASIQSGIVERIRKEIVKHGLTAEHLFGFGASTTPNTSAKKQTAATAGRPSAKFSDDQGNSWSGRGPKPAWLRSALAAGRSIDEFLSADAPSTTKPAAKSKSKSAAAGKAPKFADAAGNSWGGMGKRPGWIRSALEAGSALSDFLVTQPKAKAAAPVAKTSAAKKPAAKTSVAKPAAAKPVAKTAIKAKSKATGKATSKAKKAAPVKAVASKKPVKKAASPAMPFAKKVKAKAVPARAKRGSAAVIDDAATGAAQPTA